MRSLMLAFVVATGAMNVAASDDVDPVRIGALAKRGNEHCLEKWTATAEHLTQSMQSRRFVIEPLGFDDVLSAVADRRIDFLLTNPAQYVEAEAKFGASRIVTLRNLRMGNAVTSFGGVIFARKDSRRLETLADLKGRTFMAVDPGSLGGWLMAWREMNELGIDPERDLASLTFAGTHDEVVVSVVEGRVDVGTVRTETLERMAVAGLVDLAAVQVLHDHGGDPVHLPFLHSTRGS